MFYEMETTRAVRADDWKYVARHPDGPYELYDMQADPQERFNLFGQPGTEPRTRRTRQSGSTRSSREYADPQYDIWKGGRSKARRLAP